jgi:hypothetical protein
MRSTSLRVLLEVGPSFFGSFVSNYRVGRRVQVHDRIQFLQAIENAIEHEYGPS